MSQLGIKGSVRIAILYMAGVLFGALGASIVQPEKYLIGASAGVYALIFAHLGNLHNDVDFKMSCLVMVSILRYHISDLDH